MDQPFNTEKIEHCGIVVKIEYFYDGGIGAPWEIADGHGNVTRVSSTNYAGYIDKKPGQVVLYRGGRNEYSYLYDFADAMKTARADGWNAKPYNPEGDTPGTQALRAVNADMGFIRGWLNDDWHYVGVVCTVLDANGEDTNDSDSCWGFESLDDYHETAGREMAEALAESTHKARLHQWRAALKEARARKYWACRDVCTVVAV